LDPTTTCDVEVFVGQTPVVAGVKVLLRVAWRALLSRRTRLGW
jgi:hypothetical protein